MAYQPKSYRKFVATAATATLVASAVAPVAMAASFTDVQGEELTKAVDFIVAQGIAKGYADGKTFGAADSVKRIDAAVMFARALKLDTAAAPASGFTDVPADRAGFVNALKAKGFVDGKEATKFGVESKITRNEMSKILADAMGLKVDTAATVAFTDVNKTFAPYVKAVTDAGLIDPKSATSFGAETEITRGEIAVAFYRALGGADVNSISAATVVDSKTIEVTFDKALTSVNVADFAIEGVELESATIKAAKAADAVKTVVVLKTKTELKLDTKYAIKYKGLTTDKLAVEYKITVANAVANVSATNLKEIVVAFNGTVEKEVAEELANYSLKSGKTLKSAVLSEDKRSVTLTVTGTLANNKTESLTVSNFIDAKNVEFTTVDNKLPEVESIKSLGTKSLKVVFSEPVTDLKQSNFTLDGKAYFGKVELGANNRTVVLSPFSTSALVAGDHTVTISGVKDFAGFVSLSTTQNFTVVEDKDAPTVVEATATLETVTLTFSEDVDPSTLSSSKVYWKSGDSKKTATGPVEDLGNNKYKYTFATDKTLPTGTVDIYVEGVKDYSGNTIAASTKVAVTPVIDQTRPEVKKATVDGARTIKVTFSKSLLESSVTEVKNYSVLNKDGKVVSVQSATVDPTDSKTVIIRLYSDLSTGENTLTIKNLQDNTKLRNTMLDYSGKIVKSDTTPPKFDSTVVNKNDRRVVIKFSKKMNVETLADYTNYLVKIDGQLQSLSADIADISVLQDGTAVAITFVETISGDDVLFHSSSTPASGKVNIQEVHVLGLKDAAGNLLKEFAAADTSNVIDLGSNTAIEFAAIDSTNYGDAYVAKLVDDKTVKIKFNAGINAIENGAFSYVVDDVEQVSDVEVDGTSTVTVKFKHTLGTDASGLELNVDFSKLITIAGHAYDADGVISIDEGNLLDTVAPEVIDPAAYAVVEGNVIKITYSEVLEAVTGAHQDLRDTDFSIVRISDNKKLNPVGDYDVTVDDNKLLITLTDSRSVDTAYRVTIEGADYFNDLSEAENTIVDSVGQSVVVKSGLTLLNDLLEEGTTLTVADYKRAGITGVTTDNLTDVNTAVVAAYDDADLTKAAIQALVDEVNAD